MDTEPRRYLTIKLAYTNGNPCRGWLVYLDTPEAPLLGWVEEGYGGESELLRAVLAAENPNERHTQADRGDLRRSGRVRILSSLSVPFSEVRDARRTPFALPKAEPEPSLAGEPENTRRWLNQYRD